jgi:DNA-binding transcriptional LysR family regulator
MRGIELNLIDIGFVTMPVSGRTLEITPVYKDEFVLIAPSSMSLPARLISTALLSTPLILFEPGGNTRQIVDKWLHSGAKFPKPLMSLGSVEAIKEMVRSGLGCSILPGMAVGETNRWGLQVRRLSPKLYRHLGIVIRRDKKLTNGLKATLRALKALQTSEHSRS